jgi:hypothetical protein
LSPIKCNEKDEIKFECEFNKDLKAEDVIWLKDGVKIDDDEKGRLIFINDGPKQALVVKNCQLQDAGVYECRSKTIKSQAALKVKGKNLRSINNLLNVLFSVVDRSIIVKFSILLSIFDQ